MYNDGKNHHWYFPYNISIFKSKEDCILVQKNCIIQFQAKSLIMILKFIMFYKLSESLEAERRDSNEPIPRHNQRNNSPQLSQHPQQQPFHSPAAKQQHPKGCVSRDQSCGCRKCSLISLGEVEPREVHTMIRFIKQTKV